MAGASSMACCGLGGRVGHPVSGTVPLRGSGRTMQTCFLRRIGPGAMFFCALSRGLGCLVRRSCVRGRFLRGCPLSFVGGLVRSACGGGFHFGSFVTTCGFCARCTLGAGSNGHCLRHCRSQVIFGTLFLTSKSRRLTISLTRRVVRRHCRPTAPAFLGTNEGHHKRLISYFLVRAASSVGDVNHAVGDTLRLSHVNKNIKIGLSGIQTTKSPVGGVRGTSDNIIPVVGLLRSDFDCSGRLNRHGKTNTICLDMFRPSVITFLSAGGRGTSRGVHIGALSLNLIVPSGFCRLTTGSSRVCLFDPCSIRHVCNGPFSCISVATRCRGLIGGPRVSGSGVHTHSLRGRVDGLRRRSNCPCVVGVSATGHAGPMSKAVIVDGLYSRVLRIRRPSLLGSGRRCRILKASVDYGLNSAGVPGLVRSPSFKGSIRAVIHTLACMASRSDVSTIPAIGGKGSLTRAVNLNNVNLRAVFTAGRVRCNSPRSVRFASVCFVLLGCCALTTDGGVTGRHKRSFIGFRGSGCCANRCFSTCASASIIFRSRGIGRVFRKVGIPAGRS